GFDCRLRRSRRTCYTASGNRTHCRFSLFLDTAFESNCRRRFSMLRLLGTPRTLCDGRTRRDFLHLGGLGALGFGLSDWLRLNEARAATARPTAGFGSAKACILLFPYGSPPQHETFDPKPDAPQEVRGELGSIATSVPGLRICDLLPRIARVMDKVTVVRSVTHPYPVHGVAYVVTGMPT